MGRHIYLQPASWRLRTGLLVPIVLLVPLFLAVTGVVWEGEARREAETLVAPPGNRAVWPERPTAAASRSEQNHRVPPVEARRASLRRRIRQYAANDPDPGADASCVGSGLHQRVRLQWPASAPHRRHGHGRHRRWPGGVRDPGP